MTQINADSNRCDLRLVTRNGVKTIDWPVYFFPVLVRFGHLKPLGKPGQNSRKWFASAEIERLSRDLAWLDKAVRIMEKHVHDLNAKQRGKDLEPALAESFAS